MPWRLPGGQRVLRGKSGAARRHGQHKAQSANSGQPRLRHPALGDAKRAEALLLESLTLKYELQDEIGLSYCFAGLAGVSCELEKFERAAVLLGVVDTLLERTKHQLDLADRRDAERALAAARARPALDVFSAAWKRGKGMILEQAARYALGHECTRPCVSAPIVIPTLEVKKRFRCCGAFSLPYFSKLPTPFALVKATLRGAGPL